MTDYRGGGMASMKIRQIEKDVEKMKAELEEKKKEIEKVFLKKLLIFMITKNQIVP